MCLAPCTCSWTSQDRSWALPLTCWEECTSREQFRSSGMVCGARKPAPPEPPPLTCIVSPKLCPKMSQRRSRGSWLASLRLNPASARRALLLLHMTSAEPAWPESGAVQCLLSSAFCLLPSVSCLLPSAFCLFIQSGKRLPDASLVRCDDMGAYTLHSCLGLSRSVVLGASI